VAFCSSLLCLKRLLNYVPTSPHCFAQSCRNILYAALMAASLMAAWGGFCNFTPAPHISTPSTNPIRIRKLLVQSRMIISERHLVFRFGGTGGGVEGTTRCHNRSFRVWYYMSTINPHCPSQYSITYTFCLFCSYLYHYICTCLLDSLIHCFQ
jgi:hypothetical protein